MEYLKKTIKIWKIRSQDLFANKLNVHTEIDLVYRLGKKSAGKQRPVKVQLVRVRKKKQILKNRAKLKETKVYLNKDLSPVERENEAKPRRKAQELTAEGKDAKVRANSIWIGDEEHNLVNERLMIQPKRDRRQF